MRNVTAQQQRDSMIGMRDCINQRLASLGLNNDNAKSPIGRMRYAQQLQQQTSADDLRGEVWQQLSPTPKPRNDANHLVCFSLFAKSFFFFSL